MKKFIKILIIALIPIVLIVGISVYIMSRMPVMELDNGNETLGINGEQKEFTQIDSTDAIEETERTDIVNIALFGLDRRSQKQVSRSDSMIVLSLDFKHKKIKMASLMRDLYVPIEGYRAQKLNHAYALGGAQLAIKTINQSFDTNIRHFVSVDFFALEEIIDVIGGIKLDVKDNEIKNINQYIGEIARINKTEPINLNVGGEQILNGAQSVAYARIRSVGNGDFERTERQRRVLSKMIETVKEKGVSVIPDIIIKVLPFVETNITKSEMLEMGIDYFKNQPMQIEQNRFPLDGHYSADVSTGTWYLKVDYDDMKKTMHEYIYEVDEIESLIKKTPLL